MLRTCYLVRVPKCVTSVIYTFKNNVTPKSVAAFLQKNFQTTEMILPLGHVSNGQKYFKGSRAEIVFAAQ
jgi:hypothetical protein